MTDTTVRQLVVCCDGTNNTLTGGRRDTNVLRLFQHLAGRDAQQRLYYDPGVGSPDTLPATGLFEPLIQQAERAIGLAVGRGIYENIGQAYLFLCREYRRGDQIYLFGFSRGAFTVRCVAGMVNMFGLLRAEHEPLLPTLLRIYFAGSEETLGPITKRFNRMRRARRSDGAAPATRQELADQVRQNFTSPDGRDAPIHFTGVWDTVESVGIRGLRKSISNKAELRGKRFTHVRHALSLDEHRYAFLPRYYTAHEGLREDQTLMQVWFRGVHSDVGGGAAFAEQSGLSFVALDWMLDEARDCGLRAGPVAPREPAPSQQLNDRLHATPWWAVAGMALREPAGAPGGNVHGASLAQPFEHPSVAAATPASAWAQWRSWGWLVFALAWCAVWAVLSGTRLLAPSLRVQAFDPATWSQALASLQAGADLAHAQLAALWRPAEVWREIVARVDAGASPAAAWWLDGLLIAGYAYVLARIASRSFAWLARWRRVGDARPTWDRLALGRALPTMLIGDGVENVCGLLALAVGGGPWSVLLLWLGALGAVAKWLGLAGVGLLAGLGWRGRRHPLRA